MHNRNIGAENGPLGQSVEFITYQKLEICKVSWGVQIIMQNNKIHLTVITTQHTYNVLKYCKKTNKQYFINNILIHSDKI